jgi:imidazolonepropionase-like amidohydrolase
VPDAGQLVAAGVDSVEHGFGLDERAIREMADRGTAWTPTVTYHHDPREDPGQLAHPAAVVAGGTRLR